MGSEVPGFSGCNLSTDDIFEVHEQGLQTRTT
jgi:hypothetical protein